jgi:hypothetical protein
MATLKFPELRTRPAVGIPKKYRDGTLRTKFESGYIATRQTFTKIKRSWSLSYNVMLPADMADFEAFLMTMSVGGANMFDWKNPIDSVVYTVRFTENLPQFEDYSTANGVRYKGTIEIEEV